MARGRKAARLVPAFSPTRVLVGEIARGPLDMKLERVSKGDNLRITAVLKRLGWQRSETKSMGYFPWIRPQSRPFLRLVA
jgi:hypothetical protein